MIPDLEEKIEAVYKSLTENQPNNSYLIHF